MSFLPSLQMLDEPVYPSLCDDQQSLYDPFSVINMKSEPGKETSSCTALMASSLPPFDQTFFNCSYPTVDDSNSLQSWTANHPDHWSTKEVLDWVFFVVHRHNLDASIIPGENFQNVTGLQLCRMPREEFIARDRNFGAYIYDVLQDLLTGSTFTEPECDTTPATDNFPMIGAQSYVEDTFTDISNSTCTEEGIKVLIGGDLYDIDIKPIDLPGMECTGESSDPGYYSESGSDMDRDSDCHSVLTDTMDTETFPDMYSHCLFPPKRYHSESLSSACSDVSEETDLAFQTCQTPPQKQKTNRGRPPGQASKGNHLWEFIRDTLKDTKFNPALLKWENKEEGVFRFVQSEAVAQMWGRKKNNPCMTYEKLSRAMRYYYQRGILDRVEGKRLVYKFGKNSHGWKD